LLGYALECPTPQRRNQRQCVISAPWDRRQLQGL
jgi:hypothetical protein